MSAHDLTVLGTELLRARASRTPIQPLSERHPAMTVADAYAIQAANRRLDLDAGATWVGHKIGLTSFAMQDLLGVDEPDYGYLLDRMVFGDGAELTAADYLAPRAEPEIAFRLHTPLTGPGVTAADVMAATEAVAPAIEIVDSRIVDWRITLIDTIADNASSAAAVVGDWIPLADVPPPTDVACDLHHDGVHVASGVGNDVLGDPAEAVAWLANALGPHGITLEPGQLLLPGSLTTAVFVHAGQTVTADFGALGSVTVRFV